MQLDEIKKYNRIVENIVGKTGIASSQPTNVALNQYYAQLGIIYRKFHSEEGAMHFPIKFAEDQKHKEKLLYQAQTVEKIIQEKDGAKVLELGCGMGFNTIYLAKNNPNVQFDAIDIAANNIKIAKKKASKLSNVSLLEMDFDRLNLPEKKYDVIFGVETLCYSKDLIGLLNKLSSMLTEEGKIIIFDAFVRRNSVELNDESVQQAYRLLLWGWSLEKFDEINNLAQKTQDKLYTVEEMVDFSDNIVSNNQAYQNGAIHAFKYTFFLKLLLVLKIIPIGYIQHLTAGLYSSHFMQSGFLGYFKLVIGKKKAQI
jgi:ubiquinone/menaquinone biosynthesis C-methylase UbiE